MVTLDIFRKESIVSEHIKMTAPEAKQKAEAIRKIILDTYHKEVKPSPFFTELRAGTLSRARLQGWIKNWYAFAVEVNTGMATVYHQFVGFFKRHPELEDMVAQKIGEEFTTPGLGGHARVAAETRRGEFLSDLLRDHVFQLGMPFEKADELVIDGRHPRVNLDGE